MMHGREKSHSAIVADYGDCGQRIRLKPDSGTTKPDSVTHRHA